MGMRFFISVVIFFSFLILEIAGFGLFGFVE